MCCKSCLLERRRFVVPKFLLNVKGKTTTTIRCVGYRGFKSRRRIDTGGQKQAIGPPRTQKGHGFFFLVLSVQRDMQKRSTTKVVVIRSLTCHCAHSWDQGWLENKSS